MCFLSFGKLILSLIYAIVLFGLIFELALPHWRLYVNENGEAQLQTGLLGQCGTFGTLLKFNDSVNMIGTEVCEKWVTDRPTTDYLIIYFLTSTIIILIFNLLWITLSFCQCCCNDCCFFVLPCTSIVGTLFLLAAVAIFNQNYQNDGETGISTKYIQKHSSYYILISLIYPMLGSILGAAFTVFLEDSCFYKVEK